jgi:hypothetical protein
VVEVGVGQQDRVDRRRVVRERNAVPDGLVRAALEHAAVDEDAGAVGDEQELRAGNRRGPAEKVDLHSQRIVPWPARAARSAARVSRAALSGRPLGRAPATRR